jgi:uncharacterized protein YdeI (YjbR/CyaY-like superfamily)
VITDIEDFFTKGCGRCERFDTPDCVTRQWEPALLALRRICRDAGLAETVKWGHPCYMHGGRNVVLIGALRGDVRLNFFHAALMADPEGVLERQGPNTRHPDSMKFTANAQVTEREAVIRAYLAEAMRYAEEGILPPKEEHDLELPDELVEALAGDPELSEAWDALTPGRRRSYVIHLGSAKTTETRVARIGRSREKILSGRGANER